MKALALDIGAGTIDFLLYDDRKAIENSIKLVLPSPPRFYAEKVKKATKDGVDLNISGYTIGGGPLISRIKEHVSKGNQAFMTPSAAYSLRNDLEEVRAMGVDIIGEEEELPGRKISLDEVQLGKFEDLLNGFGETLRDVDLIAVSVKDHGAPDEPISNREFRIKKFRDLLSLNPSLDSFLFREDDIPDYFLRMKSGSKAVKDFLPDVDVYLMDTSPSALRGCLEDPNVENKSRVLAVNVGNGHTMAALLMEMKILGFFEHHTSSLTGDKLEVLMRRLLEGKLTHSEVFDDGGHGAVVMDGISDLSEVDIIAVTGPMRRILDASKIDYVQAAPGGDMMITGTIGILSSVIDKHYN
jgi:uncharacterized protein (DUF1786 family)